MFEALAKSESAVAMQRDYTWRAKQAYQQALRLKPGWSEALAGMARVEELEGNPQRAAEYFQQSLQSMKGTESGDATCCHEAGLFYCRMKQFDLGVAALQRAVQIDPRNRTFAMNYGFALARAGRFEEGYTYFSRIMPPSDAAYQIAQMSQHLGDTERTKQFAAFALQQNPSHAQAQQLMARMEQPAVQQVQGIDAVPQQ